MLFDVYHDGFHAIDIYVRIARYEIKDDRAFEVTRSGRRQVPVLYARQRVNQWREREAKTLTVAPPTRRQMAMLVTGWALIAVTLAGALLAVFW